MTPNSLVEAALAMNAEVIWGNMGYLSEVRRALLQGRTRGERHGIQRKKARQDTEKNGYCS